MLPVTLANDAAMAVATDVQDVLNDVANGVASFRSKIRA
jgi:hypothetical protein